MILPEIIFYVVTSVLLFWIFIFRILIEKQRKELQQLDEEIYNTRKEIDKLLEKFKKLKSELL